MTGIDSRFSILPGGRLHRLYRLRRAERELARATEAVNLTVRTIYAELVPALNRAAEEMAAFSRLFETEGEKRKETR